MSSEGPGIEYAGYRLGLFEKYQGGEIKIKTAEDVEKVLNICSWIIFHINRGLDTSVRADSENSSIIKTGREISEEEVKSFMKNKKFERINSKAYFRYVKKDEVLPIAQKWEESMIKQEERLVKGEISFSSFKIILEGFHKATDELGFNNLDGYNYIARNEETIKIFNKNGFYPVKNGFCGYARNLRFFKEKEEEKPSSSFSSKTSRKLTPEELEIRKEVVKNKYHYRNKSIDGKKVWGISYKAIVLVNDIDIDPETGRRWIIGTKDFHNFFRKINDSTSDDGIEIAKKLIKLYGE